MVSPQVKILLLSDTYSEHTEKWALGLAEQGFQIGLFSFNKASYPWYEHPNITVFFEPDKKINAESNLTKLAYIKYVTVLKRIIKQFKPDILHAHYATSYGLVGALSGFRPFIISAWGTDVMKFPQKNFVAKSILKYNFKNADVLCATSETIKTHIGAVSSKTVEVIPFGVDTQHFKKKKTDSPYSSSEFVIGSIKPLESLYHIDVLLKSFASVYSRFSNARLLIIGEGSEKNTLEKQAEALGIHEVVRFTGRIPFSEVNHYFNQLNALVNISQYESFGVSVIEAMACEVPVIVSDTGGLKEIVYDDSVGIKVPVNDVDATTKAIEELIQSPEKCAELGKNGRQLVLQKFDWQLNLDQMITIYKKLKA